MPSSLSWIDESEFRTALAGFAGSRLAASDHPGVPRYSPAPENAGPSAPAPFEPPRGSLQDRLEAFVSWLTGLAACKGAFVIDEDGLPLLGRSVDSEMMAISASFLKLLERINSSLLFPVGDCLAIALGGRDQLQLAEVATSSGGYAVGMVVNEPLPRPQVEVIQRTLRRVFELEERP